MNEKNFLTISAKECQSEYKSIIQKSQRKLKSAEILAQDYDYDSAISLLIISNEELIKAVILFLDGQGFELRKVKGINSLFNNHRLRYLLALVFSVMAIIGEDLKSLLLKVREDPSILKNFYIEQTETERKLYNYIIEKIHQLYEEISFFSQLDKIRQIGLYSDKPGNLQLTEQKYLQFHGKIIKLKRVIIYFIESFKLRETEEQVRILKETFKKEDFYNLLAKLISTINNPKINSYKALSDALKEVSQELDIEAFFKKN